MKKIFSLLILFSVTFSALLAQGTRRDSMMNFSKDNFKNAAVSGITRDKQYEMHRMTADYIKSVEENAAKSAILDISSTLLSTGNTPYAGKFVRENNSSFITCFIDKSGVKHLINRQTSVGYSGVEVDASNANSDFKGAFVKEGSSFITAYVDAYGVRHSVGVDGNLYATKAKVQSDSTLHANNINSVNSKTDAEILARTAADAAAASYNAATYVTNFDKTEDNNTAHVAIKYTVVGDSAYIAQDAEARIGDPTKPYVNLNKALIAIALETTAKRIERGVVRVKAGTVFRICEDTDTILVGGAKGLHFVYSGSGNGSPFHPTLNPKSSCINYPNVKVIFEPGSGITQLAGRGYLVLLRDTSAPQSIVGQGSFNYKVTNNRNGNISNVNMIGGSTKGEFQFDGDTLVANRFDQNQWGWTMIQHYAALSKIKFKYVETYENNSLFRCNGELGSTTEIDYVKTDTTSRPYGGSVPWIHSGPVAIFLNTGGYGINTHIKSAYIASNQLTSLGFYGMAGQVNFKCDKLTQKFRSTYQNELIGSAQSTTPQNVGSNSQIACAISFSMNNVAVNNVTANIKIGTYSGQSPALVFTGIQPIKNSNIKIDLGDVTTDSNSLYPKTTIYINSSSLIDSSLVSINANVLNKSAEAVKIFSNTSLRLSGTFKTNSAVRNAIYLNSNANNVVFAGSAIVGGSQKSIDGVLGTALTCLLSSTANTAVSPNVTATGLNVSAAYNQ